MHPCLLLPLHPGNSFSPSLVLPQGSVPPSFLVHFLVLVAPTFQVLAESVWVWAAHRKQADSSTRTCPFEGAGWGVAEGGRAGAKLAKTARPPDPFYRVSRRSGFTLWGSLNVRGPGFGHQAVVKMGVEWKSAYWMGQPNPPWLPQCWLSGDCPLISHPRTWEHSHLGKVAAWFLFGPHPSQDTFLTRGPNLSVGQWHRVAVTGPLEKSLVFILFFAPKGLESASRPVRCLIHSCVLLCFVPARCQCIFGD